MCYRIRLSTRSPDATGVTDNNTGQNVSFLNLPLEGGSHRGVVPASAIPAPAAGPQTALIGAVYLGDQNATVSPDTPPKAPPDDLSYSAPTGGVLASITLRVQAGLSGQPSLSVDLDDGAPNAPGSSVVVFSDSGVTTIDLGESALGDGIHGEGAVCAEVAAFQANRYAAILDRRESGQRGRRSDYVRSLILEYSVIQTPEITKRT